MKRNTESVKGKNPVTFSITNLYAIFTALRFIIPIIIANYFSYANRVFHRLDFWLQKSEKQSTKIITLNALKIMIF